MFSIDTKKSKICNTFYESDNKRDFEKHYDDDYSETQDKNLEDSSKLEIHDDSEMLPRF